MEEGRNKDISLSQEGILMNKDRWYVPNLERLREDILKEAYNTPYMMHPGTTKMYRTLKTSYWWPEMKRDVVEYVARCLTCQQVKIEHQVLAGKLRPLPIPEWK